jgi:hypothetical protein
VLLEDVPAACATIRSLVKSPLIVAEISRVIAASASSCGIMPQMVIAIISITLSTSENTVN